MTALLPTLVYIHIIWRLRQWNAEVSARLEGLIGFGIQMYGRAGFGDMPLKSDWPLIIGKHAKSEARLCHIYIYIYVYLQRKMHEFRWITIFGSWVRRFSNNLANRFTNDPKMVIHGNECIILFLVRYFMSRTHSSAKNNYRSLISPLLLRTVFSYLALWHHHSLSVTSRECGVLTFWCHIRRFLFLHAQIGTKAIFTSE